MRKELIKEKQISSKYKHSSSKKKKRTRKNIRKKTFFERYFYIILSVLLFVGVLFLVFVYYKKIHKNISNVNVNNKNSTSIFVESKSSFPSIKKVDPELFNTFDKNNYDKLRTFSSENLNIFLNILAKNTTSNNVKTSLFNVGNIPYQDLIMNISKLKTLTFLDQKSKNLYNGVFEKKLGMTLSDNYKIISLNNFSSYWSYGLKLGDTLIGLDDKKIKLGIDQNIIYKELLNRSSRWKLKNGKEILVKNGKLTDSFTDIVDVYSYNNVLVFKIKNINNFISYYIYMLSKSYLSKQNYSGLIIDLQDVSDKYYLGIDSFLYLLSGKNNDYIATFNNELNKNNLDLLTKKPNFEIPDWYINKIKNIEKIVVVNQMTEGSPEIIANYLVKNGAILTGYNSKNNKEKHSVYSVNNELFSFKTNDIFIKNNPFGPKILRIEKEKYPDFLYNIYSNYNR